MSAFRTLRDVSINFEEDLRKVSSELFTAKIEESFEDGFAKKLKDLSLFTSKLRFLEAKPISSSPQISEPHKDEDSSLISYTDTVKRKLVEQQVVKAITQTHAVKALITAADSSLDPAMMERKEKIIDQLTQYREKEMQLRHLDTVLKDKQQQHEAVRARWSEELAALREMREHACGRTQADCDSPQYRKLRTLVDKMEVMRWLVSRLVARRGSYDWLADTQKRMRALVAARPSHTVDMYTAVHDRS